MKPKARSFRRSVIDKLYPDSSKKKKKRTQITNIMNERGDS